jgi:cell division protein FtsB
MVIRPRIRAFLAALGLYALAALFIGYLGINAYTGNRGILAKQDLDQRIADLKSELDAAKAERARQLLDYADPRDVTVLIRHRDWPASGRKRAPLIGR